MGRYDDENTAAAAYNKAADVLNSNGVDKVFPRNYIEELDPDKYRKLYESIKISDGVMFYMK